MCQNRDLVPPKMGGILLVGLETNFEKTLFVWLFEGNPQDSYLGLRKDLVRFVVVVQPSSLNRSYPVHIAMEPTTEIARFSGTSAKPGPRNVRLHGDMDRLFGSFSFSWFLLRAQGKRETAS